MHQKNIAKGITLTISLAGGLGAGWMIIIDLGTFIPAFAVAVIVGTWGFLMLTNVIQDMVSILYEAGTKRKMIKKKAKNKSGKLEKPPFSVLIKISEILPPRQARSLVQEVSDLRIEYYKALVEGNNWKSRIIVVSYYTGLSWSALKWIAERTKELVGFMPKVN